MNNFLRIILLIVFTTSCNQRTLTGYYSSNKAELGFFVTRLQLNPDSTFKYEFSGDLAYSKGEGKYSYEDRILTISFDEVELDSADRITTALSGGSIPTGQMIFIYKNGNIYKINESGEIVKKNYLIKREGELIWRGE